MANYDDNNWEAMKYLNLKAKEERSIDNSTLSYAFRMLCDYFKQNLCPFFDYWGWSNWTRIEKYAEQYPLMDKKIWEYNPLNPQQVRIMMYLHIVIGIVVETGRCLRMIKAMA